MSLFPGEHEVRPLVMLFLIVMVPATVLDIRPSPPVPSPPQGHALFIVYDLFSNRPVGNVTIDLRVYIGDSEWRWAGRCLRTDTDGWFVSQFAFVAGDWLQVLACHEDYYVESFKVQVPALNSDDVEYIASIDPQAFVFGIDLTPKVSEVNCLIQWTEFKMNELTFFLEAETEGCYGMQSLWADWGSEVMYSPGMIVIASECVQPFANFDQVWQTPLYTYYAFEFGRVINDSNIIDDGLLVHNIRTDGSDLIGNEFWITVIDTAPLYYDYPSIPLPETPTLICVNNTLNQTGEPLVAFGFQPSPAASLDHFDLDDLIFIVDEGYDRRPWTPDPSPDFTIDIPPEFGVMILFAFGLLGWFFFLRGRRENEGVA